MHSSGDLLSLFSLEWWISVGAVAIFLHLIAFRVDKLGEKLWLSATGRWARRSEKAKRELEEDIAQAVNSPKVQQEWLVNEFRARFQTLTMLSLGGVIAAVSTPWPGPELGISAIRLIIDSVFGVIARASVLLILLSSMRMLYVAIRCRRVVTEARKREREATESP